MTETATESTELTPASLSNEDLAERVQARLGRARLLTRHLEDQLNAHECANAAILVSLAELIGEDLDRAHDELGLVDD